MASLGGPCGPSWKIRDPMTCDNNMSIAGKFTRSISNPGYSQPAQYALGRYDTVPIILVNFATLKAMNCKVPNAK